MNELRKKFEGVSGIAIYKSEIRFNESKKSYDCWDREIFNYVNGAWMAFQEQQKKIDSVRKLADELWETSSEGRTAELIIQIQEALK